MVREVIQRTLQLTGENRAIRDLGDSGNLATPHDALSLPAPDAAGAGPLVAAWRPPGPPI
jgi:hypothetical protein